jgi:hypothetical protein
MHINALGNSVGYYMESVLLAIRRKLITACVIELLCVCCSADKCIEKTRRVISCGLDQSYLKSG